jgi:mRNA interferase RelE/StbE
VKTRFRKSFLRDLNKVGDAAVLRRVKAAIEDLEAAQSLADLANVKKMSGSEGYYRIRVGDYRLGLVLHADEVEVVRCLHRRDIYRYFP